MGFYFLHVLGFRFKEKIEFAGSEDRGTANYLENGWGLGERRKERRGDS